MIPSQVIELCKLLAPNFEFDNPLFDETYKAAWRIYNAGFRKPE